jgi:hypothetical protein
MGREPRIYERPTLERPVLIGAFRGWNDGGQAATLATEVTAVDGLLAGGPRGRIVAGGWSSGKTTLALRAAARATAADKLVAYPPVPRPRRRQVLPSRRLRLKRKADG